MEISELYRQHHAEHQRLGFSVLEQERADWFANQIRNVFGDTKVSLLDVGCRDATLTQHFVPLAKRVVGVDVDPDALSAAKMRIPNGTFIQMDVLNTWQELGEERFDVILSSEVLEHVYHPQRVCENIGRHLNPGGIFIGSVPNAFFLKHRLRYLFGSRECTPLADPTHLTQFNIGQLREILSVIGGTVLIEGYTRPPFAIVAKRWPGLWAFDYLFVVRV